jgi:cytidine deaminase
MDYLGERAKLLTAARQAALNAYCPYSQFRVGACVVMDGRLCTGCNVENASYGLTICAERVAILAAIANGCRHLEAVIVTCPDVTPERPSGYRMPCGACLQVMAEFGKPETLILVHGVGEFQLSELLPVPFKL